MPNIVVPSQRTMRTPNPIGYLISEVQSSIITEAQRLNLPAIMQILQRRSMVPPLVLPPLHGELTSFFPGSKKLTEVERF